MLQDAVFGLKQIILSSKMFIWNSYTRLELFFLNWGKIEAPEVFFFKKKINIEQHKENLHICMPSRDGSSLDTEDIPMDAATS